MKILPFPERCDHRVVSCPLSPAAPAWVLAVVIAMNHARSPDKAWHVRSLLPYQLGGSIPGHFIVLNRDYCVIGYSKRDHAEHYYGGFHVSQTHYDVAHRAGWINEGGYFFGDNPWDSTEALHCYREKILGFIAPWTILQGRMPT
jgi:hypothetical protein